MFQYARVFKKYILVLYVSSIKWLFMRKLFVTTALVVLVTTGCTESPQEVTCGYVSPTGVGGDYQKKHDSRAALAKENALCGVVYEGVSEFLSALYESPQKISEEYMNVALFNGFDEDQWGGDMIDGFRAIQVLDEHVLYNFDPYETKSCKRSNVCESDSIPYGAKLLVRKQAGEVYLEGQRLPLNNFMIYQGVTEYKSVGGYTEQATVFVESNSLGSCTASSFGKDNCAGLPN